MKYRKINLENDYPHLVKLWEKSPMNVAPPMDMMSSNAIVAYNEDGSIVGAVFIWLTQGSYTALIGFPILDMDYRKPDRKEVIRTLFDKAETIASYLGYKYSLHYSGTRHMDNVMSSMGYQIADPEVVSFLKKI